MSTKPRLDSMLKPSSTIEVDRGKEHRCTNLVEICSHCGLRLKKQGDEGFFCRRCKTSDVDYKPCNSLRFVGELGRGGSIETKCTGCGNLYRTMSI